MTGRQRDVLAALCRHTDNGIKHDWHRSWARPMDVGGFNGSHHGATLRQLHRMGLAQVDTWRVGERRTFRYKISARGRAALRDAAP